MANITKKINQAVGAAQSWDTAVDQNDTPGAIAAGDVFRISDSLFRSADTATITAAAAVTIRVNSYYTIYPQRKNNEFQNSEWYRNIGAGVETHDASGVVYSIAASGSLTLSNIGPINNIEIVTKAGNFTLLVS